MSGSEKALLRDASSGDWWLLEGFETVVVATELEQVAAALQRVEQLQRERGLTAMGFVSYEAAPAFDAALPVHPREPSMPLLWFALGQARALAQTDWAKPGGPYRLGDWRAEVDEAQYHTDIAAIKAALAAGETYQINYTYRQSADFGGCAEALFHDLQQVQGGWYAGFVETVDWALCSASPELFFTREGRRLVSKPMKGTAARGLTLVGDLEARRQLAESEKDRAENLMIVDMVRNDMGRIAEPGSVCVPERFSVEVYPRVLQMTSTVCCETEASLSEIFSALFPCASITGAPKVQSMGLIKRLEQSPRGAYTGALGFVLPDGRAQFNVAIRSIGIDKPAGRAHFGVGSGIVWDSQAALEYAECAVKSNILRKQVTQPVLVETLLWSPLDGYALLDEHLQRLANSVAYFAYPEGDARAALSAHAETLEGPSKVRLLLSPDGRIEVESAALNELPPRPRVALAAEPVSRHNRLLYHKTTERDVYQRALASRPAYDDVILCNEAGEITEASASNVVLKIEGRLYTPALACGLLPGTLRQRLLARGEIEEKVLTRDDLRAAEQVWLINSVRGWREACCEFD